MSAQAACTSLCGCGWHRLGTNQRAYRLMAKAWPHLVLRGGEIRKSLAGGPGKEAHHNEQNPGGSGAHFRGVVALVIGRRAAAPVRAGCRSASLAALQRNVERSTPTAGKVRASVKAAKPTTEARAESPTTKSWLTRQRELTTFGFALTRRSEGSRETNERSP